MRTLLIVDGYNAIFCIRSVRVLMAQSPVRSRRGLVNISRRYVRSSGHIDHLLVVFDGKSSIRQAPGRILEEKDVIFSDSSGADELIIKKVKHYGRIFRIIVASRDNFVCNNSRALGASVIDPMDMHNFPGEEGSDGFDELSERQQKKITRAYGFMLGIDEE